MSPLTFRYHRYPGILRKPTQFEVRMEAASTTERHYTVQQVADEWQVSPWMIRKLFENEPGVLCIGDRLAARKRKYVTIRIPEHVKRRVRLRLEVKE